MKITDTMTQQKCIKISSHCFVTLSQIPRGRRSDYMDAQVLTFNGFLFLSSCPFLRSPEVAPLRLSLALSKMPSRHCSSVHSLRHTCSFTCSSLNFISERIHYWQILKWDILKIFGRKCFDLVSLALELFILELMSVSDGDAWKPSVERRDISHANKNPPLPVQTLKCPR